MPNDTSTRQLINTIESKDRKFRIALAVFIAIMMIVLTAIVIIGQQTQAGVKEQLRQQAILLQQQKKSTDELKADNAEQLTKVSKQVDCISELFTHANRQSIRISDLKKCRIVQADGSIQPPAGNSSSSTNTTTPSSNPQPVDNSKKPASNGQQPGTTDTPPPTTQTKPQEILGIPVCVPFTDVCLRETI